MTPMTHRAPGLPGAVLAREEVTVELICDGYHVHPSMCRVAVAAKGPEGVMAITDATSGAGLKPGSKAQARRATNRGGRTGRVPGRWHTCRKHIDDGPGLSEHRHQLRRLARRCRAPVLDQSGPGAGPERLRRAGRRGGRRIWWCSTVPSASCARSSVASKCRVPELRATCVASKSEQRFNMATLRPVQVFCICGCCRRGRVQHRCSWQRGVDARGETIHGFRDGTGRAEDQDLRRHDRRPIVGQERSAR